MKNSPPAGEFFFVGGRNGWHWKMYCIGWNEIYNQAVFSSQLEQSTHPIKGSHQAKRPRLKAGHITT
ncbi:hypothetical protein [Pedobacter sp. ASV12]|uniref:hypothetical protein n=1 Tax=Pedobacter sp. ASV12 TaxID=2795120 RepID=UPI0018EAA17C|nr:hypothetical protein [Pedobacter sp. ASV12]